MKVYIVKTEGYRELYEWSSNFTEIKVFKNYEKANKFMLAKKIKYVRNSIEGTIEELVGNLRTPWGRKARYINVTTPEQIAERDAYIQSLRDELVEAEKKLKLINEIRNIIEHETIINELFSKYSRNWCTYYSLEEHNVIF